MIIFTSMKPNKITLIIASMIAFSATGVAQNGQTEDFKQKLSPYTRILLLEAENDTIPPSEKSLSGSISVNDEKGWEVLIQEGCSIHTKIGKIATVDIPFDKLERIASYPFVEYIEANWKLSPATTQDESKPKFIPKASFHTKERKK